MIYDEQKKCIKCVWDHYMCRITIGFRNLCMVYLSSSESGSSVSSSWSLDMWPWTSATPVTSQGRSKFPPNPVLSSPYSSSETEG